MPALVLPTRSRTRTPRRKGASTANRRWAFPRTWRSPVASSSGRRRRWPPKLRAWWQGRVWRLPDERVEEIAANLEGSDVLEHPVGARPAQQTVFQVQSSRDLRAYDKGVSIVGSKARSTNILRTVLREDEARRRRGSFKDQGLNSASAKSSKPKPRTASPTSTRANPRKPRTFEEIRRLVRGPRCAASPAGDGQGAVQEHGRPIRLPDLLFLDHVAIDGNRSRGSTPSTSTAPTSISSARRWPSR